MLYMFLCSLVLMITIFAFFDAMASLAKWTETGEGPRPSWYVPFALAPVAFAFSAPMVFLIFQVMGGNDHQAPTDEQATWQIWAVLAGSIGCLLAAAAFGLKARTSKALSFWGAGRITILVLAAVIGSVSAFKHLTFFTSNKDGVVDIQFLKEAADISDVTGCISAMALVKIADSGAATYRCPTALLFNQGSSRPFAPWPSYEEGSSEKLNTAIHQLMDDSRRESAEAEAQ